MSTASCQPYSLNVVDGCPLPMPPFGFASSIGPPLSGSSEGWWTADYGFVETREPTWAVAKRLWPSEEVFNTSFAEYERAIAPLLPPRTSHEFVETTIDDLDMLEQMMAQREQAAVYHSGTVRTPVTAALTSHRTHPVVVSRICVTSCLAVARPHSLRPLACRGRLASFDARWVPSPLGASD